MPLPQPLLPALLLLLPPPLAHTPPCVSRPCPRSFIDKLIDWNRVEQRYVAATSK